MFRKLNSKIPSSLSFRYFDDDIYTICGRQNLDNVQTKLKGALREYSSKIQEMQHVNQALEESNVSYFY